MHTHPSIKSLLTISRRSPRPRMKRLVPKLFLHRRLRHRKFIRKYTHNVFPHCRIRGWCFDDFVYDLIRAFRYVVVIAQILQPSNEFLCASDRGGVEGFEMLACGYGDEEDGEGLHDCEVESGNVDLSYMSIADVLLCTTLHHGPFSYNVSVFKVLGRSAATSCAAWTHASAASWSNATKSSMFVSQHRSMRRSAGRFIKIFNL
jgi:hypothetical protein